MKKIRFIVSLLLTAAMLPGVLPLGVHAVTMIDEIRIRNGNLSVVCGKSVREQPELL